MAAERTQPVYDQLSDQILKSIKQRRQEWGRPLPIWNFEINFPVLRNSANSPLPCRETATEIKNASSAVQTQLKSIFDALIACQELDAKCDEKQSFCLSSDGVFAKVEFQPQRIDNPPECHHRSYPSTWLTLEDADTLPEVSCVTKFRLRSATDSGSFDGFANVQPISPRVPLQLLTRLPAIQELECPWLYERMPVAFPAETMRHYSRPWEGPWRDARHDFGRAVQEMDGKIPASLRRARLWFFKPSMPEEDQTAQMPNLVQPANVDPVSSGLRALASHVEELDLRAFLTPDLFDAKTSWPHLKRLRVEFHPMRPDGSWYFVGPRGEDSDPGFQISDEHYPSATPIEEDQRVDEMNDDFEAESYEVEERRPDMFRTEPHADRIEPLLAAFAAKLKASGSLKHAELFAYLSWYPSEKRQSEYGGEAPYSEGLHRWGLKYTAAEGSSKASLEWQVGEWRPQESVLSRFEEALGGNGGLEVKWKDFEFLDQRLEDVTAFA